MTMLDAFYRFQLPRSMEVHTVTITAAPKKLRLLLIVRTEYGLFTLVSFMSFTCLFHATGNPYRRIPKRYAKLYLFSVVVIKGGKRSEIPIFDILP